MVSLLPAVSCVSAAFGSSLAVLSLFLLSTLTSLAGAVIELGSAVQAVSGLQVRVLLVMPSLLMIDVVLL